MLASVLYVHWKATRLPLAAFVILAFSVPVAVLRAANAATATQFRASYVIDSVQATVALFPLLAALTGVVIGLLMWSWDHRGNHVYALSLPVTRARYALLKFGAGLILLALPVVALWLGTALGLSLISIPETLQAYPVSLGARFLLATLITYALAFAFAAATPRTAAGIILGLIIFFTAGGFITTMLRDAYNLEWLPTPLGALQLMLLDWPGPFNVFGGSWMLIDV